MKIQQLYLKKYEVINNIELNELSDFVVIAGPNGVGKTKIKNAICYIFQNQGNPPPGSSVTLEATDEEELSSWGARRITLPNTSFLAIFTKPRKKIRTKARLIQIDSNRQIEPIQFQQVNFDQLGDPENEEVGIDYGIRKSSDRFKDIYGHLHKEKLKLITDLGTEAYGKLNDTTEEVSVGKRDDPTKPFEEIFGQLLYPKKMITIEPNSRTLQYRDENGDIRPFDQLSSGEREVVVLAFDILLQHPSDSIILIDEPEIHLHPELTLRLIKVLKSIGERNQFFLFTHSTDIISNSFETGIHFIRPKSKVGEENQTIRIDLGNLSDLDNIPNLREAIGMLSLGKKLLFVEGINTSIDRNVFSTLAKSSKFDLAIIPSESNDNINNLSLIADTLRKGVFGIELFMVRDRDSITDEEIEIYSEKSGGKLIFLPFRHMENTFLVPEALSSISQKVNQNSKTLKEIKDKLIELARNQINKCVINYVVSEIRFKAGNLDTTPSLNSNGVSPEQIIDAISSKKDERLKDYVSNFSKEFIAGRVNYWNKLLNDSLANGWSETARKYFYGKSIFNSLRQWLIGDDVSTPLWEKIINDNSDESRKTVQPLLEILEKL